MTGRQFVISLVTAGALLVDLGGAAEQQPTIQVPIGDVGSVFCPISPKADGVDYPDFYMQETEVTNEQFQQFLKHTKRIKDDTEILAIVEQRRASGVFSSGDVPYSVDDPSAIWKKGEFPEGQASYPVCLITLEDATDFCKWLSDQHPELGLFRLPTWNEWMVAAYGRQRKYAWGDKWDSSKAHTSFGLDSANRPIRTESVKSRPAGKTPQGLFGMLGNAAELINEAEPTNDNYFNLEARWMGGGFSDGISFGEDKSQPLAPRRDYWGYSHHSRLRECDLGFRIVLDPTQDKKLLQRSRLFEQNDKNWMIDKK